MSVWIFNRYTKRLEEEKVLQEGYLRWLYTHTIGRRVLGILIKRKIYSCFWGRWMRCGYTKRYIKNFVEKYAIDTTEVESDFFHSFNDFFCRKLKKDARLFPTEERLLGFPADGRHLAFQQVQDCSRFFVKGEPLSLKKLLNSETLAEQFKDGAMVISRLCPLDYHRFHFPADGIPSSTSKINGCLYSVSPLAMKQNLKNFLENKRFVTLLAHPRLKQVGLIEVGATCVGSVKQTFKASSTVKKGEEKGYFYFGGSTVITLFQKGAVRLCPDIVEQTQNGYETFARCGDVMAEEI